jgi:hypothetical protein
MQTFSLGRRFIILVFFEVRLRFLPRLKALPNRIGMIFDGFVKRRSNILIKKS